MKKSAGYYSGANTALVPFIPCDALRILDVGCGEGALGAQLKAEDPTLEVYGVEMNADAAAIARTRLDGVFNLDVERDGVALELGSVDCILYGDVLEHLHDPAAVLERHRGLLSTYGVALCSVPNVQHYSVLEQLLRGDWQYCEEGLLDATHLRFFTAASFAKVMLDAGYMPHVVTYTHHAPTNPLIDALLPALQHLRADVVLAQKQMTAYQYIIEGTPLRCPADPPPVQPISFIVCINDTQQFESNLLASPCMWENSPHEIRVYRDCASAAEGLNKGIESAKHDLVVCLHQDVYLPKGWDQRLAWNVREASDFGVMGVWGVLNGVGVGHILDRDRAMFSMHGWAPESASVLDEVLLVMRKSTPLRFDKTLGWHQYGADICFAAREAGLSVLAMDAPVFHNSLLPQGTVPSTLAESERLLTKKWAHKLPFHTLWGYHKG